jgi:hypothetical protein
MAFNHKLWSLGNRVVQLRREIETTFPDPVGVCEGYHGENILRKSLLDILDLVNQVRLAMNEPCDNPKPYDIRAVCSEKQLYELQKKFEEMELSFHILDPEKGEFIDRR